MMCYELDDIEKRALLGAAGFGLVDDGASAVIICGSAERIPIDRPAGARDLTATTRARRFDSVDDAVRMLIPAQE